MSFKFNIPQPIISKSNSIVWNRKTGGDVRNKRIRDYKSILTIRIQPKFLDEFLSKLNIVCNPKYNKINMNLVGDFDWKSLPEYTNEADTIESLPNIKVYFPSKEDHLDFIVSIDTLFELQLTTSDKSFYFPCRPESKLKDIIYTTTSPTNPNYPVYIISKGRWESRLTSKALEWMEVPYKIVVEPQEYNAYASVIDPKKILVLPDKYLGLNQGGIPARNFCLYHSKENGATHHWIIDDNIRSFYRWNRNQYFKVKSGVCFKVVEDFVNRYDNVALAGLQYKMFHPQISTNRPPIIKNTRIYSCILVNNNIPFEWRGKYNEDTDLSLRCLKAGYSTLLFQNFLCDKETTLSMKGGNTDTIYTGDGVQQKLDSLIEQHPDVVKGKIKFGRPHHEVNYKPFKDNRFTLKEFPVYYEYDIVMTPHKETKRVVKKKQPEPEQPSGKDEAI